jgi:hypothetical protein
MDDILIAMGDNLTKHRQIVQEVLEVLRKELLYLKLSKCEFKQEKAEYLSILVVVLLWLKPVIFEKG